MDSIDAMNCAIVTGKLGAGRAKAGEAINFGVGIQLKKQIGDSVEEGRLLLKPPIHTQYYCQ